MGSERHASTDVTEHADITADAGAVVPSATREAVDSEEEGAGGVSTSTRQLLAVLSCGLAAIPFFSVTIPPMADLPQHLAQIRLLIEALTDPATPYSVQWLTPYSAAYVIFGALWPLVEPLSAGRFGAMLLVVGATAAIHIVAARRGRSPWAATLASVLLFSHTLYWGFVTFVSGFPMFLLWLELISRSRRTDLAGDATVDTSSALRTMGELLLQTGCAFLLYLTHALWFGAGALTLCLVLLMERRPFRYMVIRLATLLPVAVAVLFWWPRFSSGFSTPPEWVWKAWERLNPRWWVEAGLGGVHGWFESVVVGVIALWIGAAVWSFRHRLRDSVEPTLLAVALLLAAVTLGAPDKYMNTLYFASRWAAPTLILLLLALPEPRLRHPVVPSVAVGLAVVFSLVTAMNWATFEATELDGLEASIEALPEEQRVLGLDFVRNSQVFKGRPFIQTFAWTQVAKGGELNFSFADFAPSLVKYDPPRVKQWNPALEWYPQLVTAADFPHFDYVLAGGSDEVHAALDAFEELEPVTTNGVWRLYRVE